MPNVTFESPPPPILHLPQNGVEDRRDEFATRTAATPVAPGFRAAFVENKLRILHTQPRFSLTDRSAKVERLATVLGSEAHTFPAQPTPGGVGYGFFYNDAFKTGWGLGTSFFYNLVCPTAPGGNVNTWLYLTATNRSVMGVEALISYNGQATPHFVVFDWSRSPASPWQTDILLTDMGSYLSTSTAHGTSYQVLSVWNSTWVSGGTTYRNQVSLYNSMRNGWDIVYQYDYPATDAEQKTGDVGSWGPIVETFQAAYSETNQLGALDTQLISSNDTGKWGVWEPLSSSNSYVRVDNVGFQLVFLDPDYAFTVKS